MAGGCEMRTCTVVASLIVYGRVSGRWSGRKRKDDRQCHFHTRRKGKVRTWRATDDTPPTVSTEVAFIAYPDECLGADVGVAYRAAGGGIKSVRVNKVVGKTGCRREK